MYRVTTSSTTDITDEVNQTWKHAIPTVTESGNEEERDLDFLPDDMIIASVLLSLSSSVFTAIQVLTPSKLFCMQNKIWDLMSGHRFLELSHRRMSGEGQSTFQ